MKTETKKRKTVTFATCEWRTKHGGVVIESQVVTGEVIAYGLALHPSLELGKKYGHMTISDPLTGALVAWGETPGRMPVMAALIRAAAKYTNYPGKFRGALEAARKRLADDPAIIRMGGPV